MWFQAARLPSLPSWSPDAAAPLYRIASRRADLTETHGLDTAAAEWALLDNCLQLLAYERMHRGAGEALVTRIKARIADLDLRRAA